MKKPYSLFIAVLFFFATSSITAQDLHLSKGDRIKTIPAGSYVQLELPNSNDPHCKRCPINMISGKLLSVKNEEVEIRLLESKENIVSPAGNVGYSFKKYTLEEEGPIIKIDKTDILSIVYKGRKKLYAMHPGDKVGDALIQMGILTLVFTSFTDERPTSILLGIDAAILTGAILEIIFYQPFYKTSDRSTLRKGIHKVWALS